MGLVNRLIECNVAKHGLPSGRFSHRSLRAGRPTCLHHSGVDLGYIRRFSRWRPGTFATYLRFCDEILRSWPCCLPKCERPISQLKARTGNPQKTCSVKGDAIAVVRNKLPNQESGGDPSKLAGAGKRTGGKRAKWDTIQHPSEPDSKAVIDDDAMTVICQEKRMRDILSHPEYPSSDDGFVAIAKKSCLTYVVCGGVFVDEAYAPGNFRISKIRSRGDRRNMVNRMEIPIGQTARDDFQLAYAVYKEYNWPAPKPTRPINPEPGLSSAKEETKPNGGSGTR